MKWICCLSVFIVAFVVNRFVQSAEDNNPTTTNIAEQKPNEVDPSFVQEEECSRGGGICVPSSGCPPERLSKTGTCPKQAEAGAVCCHSVSLTETICGKLGGVCRETCPETLVIARADDCNEGLKCCPLV